MDAADSYTCELIDEAAVTAADDAAIRAGLVESFPNSPAAPVFATRRWWRRQPAWRWVARGRDGGIAAHISVDDLVLATDAGPLALIGISSVYTRPEHRRRGLVRILLDRCHDHARRQPRRWSALFGKAEHYASSGYRAAGSPLIIEGRTAAVNPAFLVCPLAADAAWPAGTIDLGGPPW